MDFIKGNEQIKIDPSGIDISGAGHIIIDSEKIIGDICLNGDLSMNGNLEVYGGKIGIGKTPAYNYNLDIIGAINCTGGVYVDGSNVAGSGSGKPIVAKGMAVQICHTDYNKKVRKGTGGADSGTRGWRAIDNRETLDGSGNIEGFIVKIKPTSVNSKVMVNTVVHIGGNWTNNPDGLYWGVRLYRKVGNGDWDVVDGANGVNSSDVIVHQGNGVYSTETDSNHHQQKVWFSNSQGADNNNYINNTTASYLDSPGTTEEVMYTMWWNSVIDNDMNGYGDLTLNRPYDTGGGTIAEQKKRATTSSSLTATEIWDEAGAYIPTDAAIMVDGATDNVGIGTSTPATGVDIHKDLSLNGNIEISNNKFVITNEGHVGIGTSNPGYPFHVKIKKNNLVMGSTRYLMGEFGTDGVTNTMAQTYYGADWGSGMMSIGWHHTHLKSSNDHLPLHALNQGANSVYDHVSAWFEGGVSMLYLVSRSDKRFKTDISLVVDDTALNQVNALESKEYHYIDPLRRRPMKTIGFIAQDVKEVLPNAVKYEINYIPDEMRIISEPEWSQDASNNWLLEIPDLDMSGAFTGKAKFYVSNDPSGNDEVCKEVEIKEVETEDSTPLFPKTKFIAEFDKRWNNVLFYGKEVSDFHTIDKAQIFALHHSAIQELSRRNDAKTQRINMLENKVNNMTVVNAVLKSSNENLKNRLEALETIVAGLQNN